MGNHPDFALQARFFNQLPVTPMESAGVVIKEYSFVPAKFFVEVDN
jgi:hypothetical protein